MKITAKFAGVCAARGQRFAAGSTIEWAKGAGSKHVDCSAVAESRSDVITSLADIRRAVRPWTPCGYPGCHQGHCDECDGKGSRYASSW